MDRTFTEPARQNRRIRRRGLIVLLMTLAVGSLGAGAFSLAIFTDTAATDGGFTTGTVKIGLNPATALFNVTGMLPGDSSSSTLTVQNNGTADLRYSMTTSATNPDTKGLAAQLALTIQTGSCASPGSTIYTGPLGTAALGSPTQGQQAGDRTITFAAGSEQLCFTASLPLATGNAFQNAATTTTFTFNAEQVAHN